MKRLAALLLLLALLLVQAWRARPRALEWAPDLTRALAIARDEEAWVVVHLRRSSRPLGARMDRESLTARAVELAAHDGFVHVKLDADAEPDLAARLAGPGAALATLVLAPTPASDVVARRDGFLDADELARFLAEVRTRRDELERLRADLAARPTDPELHVRFAELLLELGANDHSEQELQLALASEPQPGTQASRRRYAHAHERLACLLAQRGQAAAAREELARFDRAFAVPAATGESAAPPPPEWADAALLTEARLAWLERHEEEAVQMLEALLARYPPSPCAAEAQTLMKQWKRP